MASILRFQRRGCDLSIAEKANEGRFPLLSTDLLEHRVLPIDYVNQTLALPEPVFKRRQQGTEDAP